MDIQLSERDHGLVLSLVDRVDAFTFEDAKKQIGRAASQKGTRLAVDLSRASFLSLRTIKYLSALAEDLRQRQSRLALIGITEKLKRQIDIYASLEAMDLYKTQEAWEQATK